MKAIILFALICSTLAQDKGELFDLDQISQQRSMTEFLALSASGDISFDVCDQGEPIFFVTEKEVTPSTVTKGNPIRMRAIGVMKKDEVVDRMEIVTQYNELTIFKDTQMKGDRVSEGQGYMIGYDPDVPTFVPAGKWNIYIKLYNDKNEQLSCLVASFTIN